MPAAQAHSDLCASWMPLTCASGGLLTERPSFVCPFCGLPLVLLKAGHCQQPDIACPLVYSKDSSLLLPCRLAAGLPHAHSSPVDMDHDAVEAPPEATDANMRRPCAAPGVPWHKFACPSSSLSFNTRLSAPLVASEGRMHSASLSHDQPGSASGTSGSGLTSSTVCYDGLRQLLDAAELVAQVDGDTEETPEPEVHSAGMTALNVQVSSSKCGFYGQPEHFR